MDDILETVDTVRRDRWGRYLVVPPDSPKPVGYTRATTVAKALDDTSSLMAWGERMTAIGLARRPDILAQIDDQLDKDKLNRLCQAAKEAGGATIRRDLGTALHSILERSWTEPLYTAPAAHQADVDAVHQALTRNGFRVVPGMNERIVVHDRHRIAGTFDLILEDSTGRWFIADIKTGSNVNYGALGFAVQLSIYATANALYSQGAAKDGSEDEREPMPEVRHDQAVIIHVEPGSGTCTLHRLHLDPGLVELAMTVRHTRTRKDLIEEFVPHGNPDRDRWIRERIAAITDKNALLALWPGDILPPKRHPSPYTDVEINTIAVRLDGVEAALRMPFGEPDPKRIAATIRPATPKPEPAPKPVIEMPDEGDMQPDLAASLAERWHNLDVDAQNWINLRVAEAAAALLPIRVREQPSARRCAIANGLFHLAHNLDSGRNIDLQAREMLAIALDDDTVLMGTLPLGAAVGLLNHVQAGRWRELIELDATVEPDTATLL